MNYGNPYSNYPYGGYGMPNYGQRQYMQPQQQMVQQQQMQPQPQMPFDMPIQDVRFVTSEEAKAFIVMPNSRALLIDKNGAIAHLKTADNIGQSVTQSFKFEEVNADGSPIKVKEPEPQMDYSQFAKKEELTSFVTVEKYNQLFERFNEMAEQLASMKKLISGGKNNGNGTGNGKQGN